MPHFRWKEDEKTLKDHSIESNNEHSARIALKLRGGVLHELSAQQGFAATSEAQLPPASLSFILPNGDQESVTHAGEGVIENLKKQALALVNASTKCCKHVKASEAAADEEADASEAAAIDKLQVDLAAASTEKKQLAEAALAAEMHKEHLIRDDLPVLSGALSGVEEKIAALHLPLFDAEVKCASTEETLAVMEDEPMDVTNTCGSN